MMTDRKRKRRTTCHNHGPLWYSVDVLTDGSEGMQEPCLGLSIWSAAAAENFNQDENSHHHDNQSTRCYTVPPKARYLLHGMPTSRLAVDQRYNLGSVKAVVQVGHPAPLDPVCLALQRAGAADLHIISNHCSPVTPRCSGPSLNICVLQASQWIKEQQPPSPTLWWRVYTDEYVVVHARMLAKDSSHNIHLCSNSQNSSQAWALLYTIRLDMHQQLSSFLVLPPSATVDEWITLHQIHQRDLPVLEKDNGEHDKSRSDDSRNKSTAVRCDFVVALSEDPNMHHNHSDIPIFYCHARPGPDPYLLVRVRQQAEAWHTACPEYFPWCSTVQKQHKTTHASTQNRHLATGTSLCWQRPRDNNDNSPFEIQQRLAAFLKRESTDKLSPENKPPRVLWPNQLQGFLTSTPTREDSDPTCCQTLLGNHHINDDNEINLDEEDIQVTSNNDGKQTIEEIADSNEITTSTTSPALTLLALGTGCAAPSSYRGASAYLLQHHGSKNDSWSVLIEAGEGVVTQCLRHVQACRENVDGDTQTKTTHGTILEEDIARLLAHISLVWISHAHWDHYGGLMALLRARCRRDAPTLLVLAPRTVLVYCKALCEDVPGWHGVAHEDQQSNALRTWNQRHGKGTLAFWDNVRVDHSCRHSYGCVVGWHVAGRLYTLAYSGDTRPCQWFVQACQRRAIMGQLDFLLHEATFDEAEEDMAVQKKHATVAEAIQVGQDTRAKRILLSHFSQRYDSLSNIPAQLSKRVGFALDGLQIILI